jgi:hypothetical protein
MDNRLDSSIGTETYAKVGPPPEGAQLSSSRSHLALEDRLYHGEACPACTFESGDLGQLVGARFPHPRNHLVSIEGRPFLCLKTAVFAAGPVDVAPRASCAQPHFLTQRWRGEEVRFCDARTVARYVAAAKLISQRGGLLRD